MDSGAFIPLDFHALDQKLQDKIKPPRKITVAERIRCAEMDATIVPAKYRRAKPAGESSSRPAAGDMPPLTNRGGTEAGGQVAQLPSFLAKEKMQLVALGTKGRFESVLIPLKDKGFSEKHAFCDWVNFTFKTSDFPLELSTGHAAVSDDDYVMCLSARLIHIFGYGVTSQRENGMNFYKSTWNLGQDGWGLVSIGGQRDSVLVTVKGQGLMAAAPGWEKRLYDFLKGLQGARLTRVDLASDNFWSQTSMDDYLQMYRAGLFSSRARTPNLEQRGNWEHPNGKGRTMYVGSRKAGKLLRIYEKGLQLGNAFADDYPNWVRVELELLNKDRVIPFDTLLCPGQYLAGAYPALARFHEVQNRVETQKKTAKITVNKSLETTRHQFGRHIWLHAQLHGPEKAIELLTKGKESLPRGLSFDTFEQMQDADFIHTEKPLVHSAGVIPLDHQFFKQPTL